MTNEDWDRVLPLLERVFKLVDKWIDRKYPEQKEQSGEVWKKGDPLPEPESKEAYAAFPSDQPGRFERAIRAARSLKDDDSAA